MKLAVQGYTFSLQFERGGTWEGTLVNLRQGWIFGREVVRDWSFFHVLPWFDVELDAAVVIIQWCTHDKLALAGSV